MYIGGGGEKRVKRYRENEREGRESIQEKEQSERNILLCAMAENLRKSDNDARLVYYRMPGGL